MRGRRSTVVRYWFVVNHAIDCSMGHTIFAGERALFWRRSSWESANLCEACALKFHNERPPAPTPYEPTEADAKTKSIGGG